MTSEFRKQILNKLLSTGMLKINRPGIIIYRNPGLFNSKNFNIRTLFLFEKMYTTLYFDTLNEIGKKRTDELWYRIGKDSAMRYLLNFKGINKNRKNMQKMIKYFSTVFSSFWISHFDKISVDDKNLRFSFSGKAPSICSVTRSAACAGGLVSGMLSFVFEKNIETMSKLKEDSREIEIIADKNFESKYFQSEKVFDEINFHCGNLEKEKCLFSGLSSFSDFFKFKVIELVDGEFKLNNKNIIPQEIGIPSIFSNNYLKIGKENLFEKSILRSSEKICFELFLLHGTIDKRMRVIRNICSALGLGEIYFTRKSSGITISLLNPFFTRGNPSLVHLFFNGVLNAAYGKKFTLKSKTDTRFEYILK